MTRWIILPSALIAALAALAALAAFGLFTPWAMRGLEGVDVSHHQGAIDWRALARSSVRFAYIKASEGASHVDTRFAENWRGAGEAGLFRGAYHFFTLCQPGLRQAQHFMRVAPHDARALPPALDVEHMGPCRRGPTMSDVQGEIRRFLDHYEAQRGVRPILYTTREFHDAHLTGMTGERFWLRSLFREPDFRQSAWVIWQHHNRARRPGVSGPIDLNIFRGDARALAQFAAQS